MVERPAETWQAVARAVLSLTCAESAGISLCDAFEGESWLHWPAAVGLVSGQISGSAPAAELPCGLALESGEAVVVERPGEQYPLIRALYPPVYGALCVPVRGDGKPVATLWAMVHDRDSTFGSRDAAVMRTLANYVALHLAGLRSAAVREASKTSQRVRDGNTAPRDVGGVLLMQQALRESEERFRSLAELLPAKLFIADPDGLNTYANHRLYELTGAAEGELSGLGWTRYVHPDDLPRVEAEWARAIEQAEPYELEYRFKKASTGEYRWFLVRSNPILDGTGAIAGWYGAAFDIDDARKAQLALRAAAESKDAFLATLAHELRNPLAPISNAARILETPRLDEKQADWCRKVIARQVSIMTRLLDDLLDLSRISQGKLELRPEPVQVWTLLGAAIETSRPLIDARRHELSVQMPEDPVRLTVDPVRITQVISNLLNNAAKYTPEGGRIGLHARVEPKGVIIEISDDGIGLAPDELEPIFDMFTQVGDRNEGQGGLGIGLALARHLIELHEGRVEARSAGVGRGSTFRVWLPRSSGEAPAADESGWPPSKVEPRRVIVADDKQDVADSLALLLKLDGHDVRVAYSGAEALHLAKTFAADVAILDIGMPGMDGYTVAREWRALDGFARPLLVALTGWGSSADKKKAADAGFGRHLTKPVSPELLTQLMRDCRIAAA